MAERKSVNKYYPPDWDPSKGSVNKYVGQHPLRDRAKKLGQGILVIRFELPYNIWCGGCNSHIGMGVRYNAEKSKTGNYYSTPIYKFRMKCHLCDNYFEIQTDPKNHDYVILEGARRKEQRWDPKENEQIVPEDKATQKKMATDAMFKLEHGSDDVKRGQKVVANLGSLELRRDEWRDDYMLNSLARQKFREEKKCLKKVEVADTDLLAKSSLEIPLVNETEEDVRLAGLMKYKTLESYDEKQAQKRQIIEDRPLFSDSKKPRTDTGSGGKNKLDIIREQIRKGKAAKAGMGAFDRMTMNSLSPSSTLTRNSLGIRRKSKDSIKPSSQTITTDTIKTAEFQTDIEDNSAKSDKNEDNISNGIQDIVRPERDTCEDSINNELVADNTCSAEFVACTRTDGADKTVLNSNSDEAVSENITSGMETSTAKATIHNTSAVLSSNRSLSLVSSYSDSDTDSSTS